MKLAMMTTKMKRMLVTMTKKRGRETKMRMRGTI
jgi:hypothetical protein